MTKIVTHAIHAVRDVALPRLRIAMVADIHACWPTMRAGRIERIVAQVQDLAPDLICLMGDYAGHSWGVRTLKPETVVPILTDLHAPLGVVAIFGNHDWKDDRAAQKARQPTRWHRAFDVAGIETLCNRVRSLTVNDVTLTLAGLDSQRAFRTVTRPSDTGADDFNAIAPALDPARFTLLLAHEPDIFVHLPDHVDLTLCGHMHGGQIRAFGRSFVGPSRFGTRFDRGVFRHGTRQMVVSAGLGTSGPPIRLNCPPEITMVELS